MSTTFHRDDVDKPIVLDVQPKPVRMAERAWMPAVAAAKPNDGPYLRPYANARRNSRLPFAVPPGMRKIRWKTALTPSDPARFVLNAGERIIVQTSSGWELFDGEGSRMIKGGRQAGEVLMDPANDLAYFNGQNGLIEARMLSSGERAFLLYPMFGMGYDRTVLSRMKNHLWIIGIEITQMSHAATRGAEYTVMEIQDLGTSLRKDEDGILASNQQVSTLIAKPVPLVSAMSGTRLVLGAPGHLFWADERLSITADFAFDGTPESVVLDDEDRVYMVHQTVRESGEPSRRLMVVSPEGEMVMITGLPLRENEQFFPPVIGYDHTTYILHGDTLYAFDTEGEVRWEAFAGGALTGAVAVPDAGLVVAAGSTLMVYSPAGERQVLFALEGERWTTPPVVTKQGLLLAASNQHLYCLEPGP